jgi:putative hydrolase of the HAD superfamily
VKKYKHLFFDLDRTLWDYETNVREILSDIYHKWNLQAYSISLHDFLDGFNHYNQLLWDKYRKGKIKKIILRDRRFYLTLKKSGLTNPQLAEKLSADYIEMSPVKTNLFPDVIKTLDYLKKKNYHLHIITNGFNEVQYKKIRNSGLENFFEKIITSDNARSQKPNSKIFEYALSSVNARKSESLMIGDDWEVDILGAKTFGIDQVYFNPTQINNTGQATYKISNIDELKDFL